MRTLTLILSAVFLFGYAGFTQAAEQTRTNEGKTRFPSLPDQFKSMTTNTAIYEGLTPVAIYRCTNHHVNFVCVGTMYWSSPDTKEVIIPEHLFTDEGWFKGAYGIRSARPDSHGLIGYINKVEKPDTNQYSIDVTFATIGTNWTSATNFTPYFSSRISKKEAVYFSPSPTVIMRGKETRRLRSLITGNEVKILGYGVKPDAAFTEASKNKENWGKKMIVQDERPYVVIEMKSKDGHSGSAFFDEHRRLFILHGGPDMGNDFLKKVDKYVEKTYGREAEGAAVLTGPLLLE